MSYLPTHQRFIPDKSQSHETCVCCLVNSPNGKVSLSCYLPASFRMSFPGKSKDKPKAKEPEKQEKGKQEKPAKERLWLHLLDLVMFISLVWLEGLAVLLLSLMSAVFTPHSRITIRNTCNQIPNYGCASWSLKGKPKKKNLATAQRLEQLRVVWHAEFEELAARSPVEAQPKGG